MEIPKSSFDLLFTEPNEITYENVEFDFKLDPDHFIRWLNEEHVDYEYKEGDYAFNVGNECEFSCLYISMLLYGKELESEPIIYSGNFGFWDHFWIGYNWKGQEYFIDLTLKQFVPTSPKLAISKSINEETTYKWYEDIEMETISEYVERQHAFDFYVDPRLVK